MAFIYATQAQILEYHDKRVVIQLTNDDDDVDVDNLISINATVLESAENDAVRIIDNFLRNIYDVPLTGADLTREIIKIAANLTWCNLWERRGDEPEQVKLLRDRVMVRLKDIGSHEADEVRGARKDTVLPTRSRSGKVRTIFDESGYFDGLSYPGKRVLSGDDENRRE